MHEGRGAANSKLSSRPTAEANMMLQSSAELGIPLHQPAGQAPLVHNASVARVDSSS